MQARLQPVVVSQKTSRSGGAGGAVGSSAACCSASLMVGNLTVMAISSSRPSSLCRSTGFQPVHTGSAFQQTSAKLHRSARVKNPCYGHHGKTTLINILFSPFTHD